MDIMEKTFLADSIPLAKDEGYFSRQVERISVAVITKGDNPTTDDVTVLLTALSRRFEPVREGKLGVGFDLNEITHCTLEISPKIAKKLIISLQKALEDNEIK